MASNRGYTTAQKVKDVMGGKVASYFTDAIIEAAINRIEGVIDSHLRHSTSGNITGANNITWTTGYSVHWVIEGAATYGTALQLCSGSTASWNTLDQLINAQNTFSYMFKTFMDIIEDEMTGGFVGDQ